MMSHGCAVVAKIFSTLEALALPVWLPDDALEVRRVKQGHRTRAPWEKGEKEMVQAGVGQYNMNNVSCITEPMKCYFIPLTTHTDDSLQAQQANLPCQAKRDLILPASSDRLLTHELLF